MLMHRWKRVLGCALALGLATAFPAPISSCTLEGAYATKIVVLNDTPNRAFVEITFFTVPFKEDGQWADAGGTAQGEQFSAIPFITYVSAYIETGGDHRPITCEQGTTYANTVVNFVDRAGAFKIEIFYDPLRKECYLHTF